MSKATRKKNFNVQFIVNRIDFILFAANVQLVDQIHWYMYLPCISIYSNIQIQYLYMIIANIRFITTTKIFHKIKSEDSTMQLLSLQHVLNI